MRDIFLPYICSIIIKTNNKNDKRMKHIFIFAILLVASAATDLLAAHVILSIANLYSLSFILQFSFLQVFGLFFLSSIFTYKYEKYNKEETDGARYINGFTKAADTALHYLLVWGITFLAFSILS